jgi:hypothetical protein
MLEPDGHLSVIRYSAKDAGRRKEKGTPGAS